MNILLALGSCVIAIDGKPVRQTTVSISYFGYPQVDWHATLLRPKQPMALLFDGEFFQLLKLGHDIVLSARRSCMGRYRAATRDPEPDVFIKFEVSPSAFREQVSYRDAHPTRFGTRYD